MNNDKKTYTLEQVIESMYDFTDYSPEEKETVIEETSAMITEAALLQGLDAANENIQTSFNDLLDAEPDDGQIMTFIQKNIPDFEEYIAKELEIFASLDEEQTNT
jgi:hypothetical protein